MQFNFFQKLKSWLRPIILESWHSPVSQQFYILSYSKSQFKLSSETATQSFGKFYHSFDYPFKETHLRNQELDRVLMLGLGLGSIIRVLQENGNQIHQLEAVELDASIIQRVREYQILPKDVDITIHQGSAWDWLMEQKEDNCYDLICVDLYFDQTVILPEDLSLVKKLESMLCKYGRLYWSFPDDEPKLYEVSNQFSGIASHIESPSNQILVLEK